MNDFWESRFGEKEYAYGTEPNAFLKQQLNGGQEGNVLFPAEGEGRNAVYAARLGYRVFAFDPSTEGRKKALALADRYAVQINYEINTYADVTYPEGFFDVVVLIFAHMPPDKRQEWHRKLSGFLKPGGKLILEGFSKEQLAFGTGGPPNIDMLFSQEELLEDFKNLDPLSLETKQLVLDEGLYHRGLASVIRGVFTK